MRRMMPKSGDSCQPDFMRPIAIYIPLRQSLHDHHDDHCHGYCHDYCHDYDDFDEKGNDCDDAKRYN